MVPFNSHTLWFSGVMGEWATSYHASSVVAPQDSNPSVGVFVETFFLPKKCAKVTVSHMMVFLLCLWLDVFCPKIGLEDDDIDISIWHGTSFLRWLNSPFSYLNHHQLAKQKSPESSPANLYLKSYLLIPETAAHGYACHVPLKTAPPQPKRMAIYAKDGGSCVQKVPD